MLVFGNEREIQQGEDWNLDILLSQSNLEYIPFIISSERTNPMWAITVASTKYEKNERYVDTWWLELSSGNKPLPRFFQTVVTDLPELAEGHSVSRPLNDEPMHTLYRYTKATDSIDPALGHKPYYYVYFTKDDPNTPKHDYECRIRMQFLSDTTSKWGSQNYMYQITLVDTIPMADVVNQAYEEHPELQWIEWIDRSHPDWINPIKRPDETDDEFELREEASWKEFRNNWIMKNINDLYPFIKNRLPNWFQSDIDIDAPVGRIGVPQVILPPTKLQVNNNLRIII